MQEVMIDLETLSTQYNAVILTIGAIKFDRDGKINDIKKLNKEIFYRRITIDSCKELGLHVDSKTVDWWKSLDQKIYDEAFGKDRISLRDALIEFSIWFGKLEKVWSNGAGFDIPILENAYRVCGLQTPWKFWNVRDTRTMYDLANITKKDLGDENEHHAVYDCWRQIYGVQESMRRLKQ